MAEKIKSPVLILVVLILISLVLSGGIFYFLQKERSRSASLQGELEDLKAVQKATEAKLEESKKSIKEYDAKLQEAESQINKLNADLAQERSAKEEAAALAEQLRTDLEQQKSLRSDLEKKLSTAQSEATKIQGQLKELLAKKDDLEKKVKKFEEEAQASSQSVELGKVVVAPEAAAPAAGAVKPSAEKQPVKPAVAASEGKVLVVNKDYNFAVINLGVKDGINLGDVFSVYRENKYLGDIKVEKVHESMSAAGFLSSGMQDKTIEGDKVVKKTKP